MSPNILFSDNHLLVVEKPSGMPTQPSPSGEVNLEEWAKAWVKKNFSKAGNVFLTPIHRLDKPAHGIVLFARTSKALSRLNEMMREKKLTKIYQAKFEGNLPAEEGTLEHYLVHDDFHAKVATETTPGAKKARLKYQLIAPGLVEIELETGRYHQIRAQLSAIGCPIRGDTKYGSSHPHPSGAIALHHIRLSFPHPVTKAPLTFSLPPWKIHQ